MAASIQPTHIQLLVSDFVRLGSRVSAELVSEPRRLYALNPHTGSRSRDSRRFADAQFEFRREATTKAFHVADKVDVRTPPYNMHGLASSAFVGTLR